eukprot:14030403-Alexandrium_andersonii.AAC.1
MPLATTLPGKTSTSHRSKWTMPGHNIQRCPVKRNQAYSQPQATPLSDTHVWHSQATPKSLTDTPTPIHCATKH